MKMLQLDDFNIPYVLQYEARKSFAAHVYPGGKVVIKAPREATVEEIEGFVQRKTSWICKQIGYFGQFNPHKKLDLSNGAELFYLGKQYQIVLKRSSLREYIAMEQNKFVIYSPLPNHPARIKNIYVSWLQENTLQEFTQSLQRCLKQFDHMPIPTLKIQKMFKRWGSHLKPHTVILNTDLIYVAKKCIDYVVTHELCHYYCPDHSSTFYALLASKIPGWAKVKAELERSIYYTL